MHTCPRCDSNTAEILCESPVAGCWVMYICPVCTFTWRSTEPNDIVDAKMYDPRFKINPLEMDKYQIHPAIPERKAKHNNHILLMQQNGQI
ncbi:non-oxidative hydroxyarylic acid decarboxylases subunit D [Alicyclobacillus suci]|uniref:non-oxidative hydroxyarylic acid decarboxylases subunit D n=1 Tax=Alicyclobacillus suci TaxID=2816080 RepID=UPI001F39DCDB|nr:non-oxidative hydroxyarylic acid decarboxylases subunit D [Alicyclobacillus suci]